jgi:hypothetical protein
MPSIMPTLADRGDLAPRARHLLAQQLAECGALLEPLLRNVLDDLEHELFRIAEQSSGGQAQHEAMEAVKEVKRNRPRFQGRLMGFMERRFASVGRPQAEDASTHGKAGDGDLALVDPQEFDETMALDDLSTRTELHAGNAIFDLCHRYAVLVAAPPLDNEGLPPGPHILASVLNESAVDLGLEREHRLLFYRLCDRRLFGAAESFYGRLNEHLKASGILPDLRSYLPKRTPSEPRPAPAASAPDEASAASPIAPVTNFTPPPAPPMSELHALLDARRQALHPEARAAAAQSAQFASMPELQEALSALQALPSRKAGAPQGGERLAGDLLAQLRRGAHGNAVQLQPEHRDAMELVGLLYDQLLTETRSEGIAQQLLANLQVPLLRVALSDNDFFTVRNHPARRLLNLVLETANLWLDRSDDHFDVALNQRLQRSVDRVASEYQGEGDLGVIKREADDLDSHLRLLSRRAEIAERRQVEAAQGRNRLREARAAAADAIGKRLAGHKTTPLVRALLENAWTDALTLTLLREGENSEAYRRRLAAADQLLGSSVERDDAKLASDLNHGLTQVGLQAAEADQITRFALDLPQRPATQAAAPPPSQTELLIRLKSRHKPGDDEPASPAEAGPRKLALTPSERRALETLKQLPFGSWLEFTVNQQGQKVARKLAWFAPTSGRCLLVNARGAAAPERTLDQIARMMARGQVRLIPRQDGGMIDRAWNALVTGLRKFSRSNQPTEPAA